VTAWERGWGPRGVELELQRLGGQRTLPSNAPTIDDFSEQGVAASIKSIDLNAPSYADPVNLSNRIDRYVDGLVSFDSMFWGRVRIEPNDITGRVLDIVVPKNSGTPAQGEAITRSMERANRLGIHIFLTYY
jgi:filamentous hemagglutinin